MYSHLINSLAADPPGLAQIAGVITNLQRWLFGILSAIATLYFVVGGVRYITAGTDPSEVERAKSAFKSAALGYALAILAPVFMTVLKGILGVS